MFEIKPLQRQVELLIEDLRQQVAENAELHTDLRHEYVNAAAADRVGGAFEAWLEDVLDQAAVAWVMGCIFIRFCEDQQLVDPLWIGGPLGYASVERAVQARQKYLIANPLHNDRHWLYGAFRHLGDLRATGRLFDTHCPVWRFPISGRAAEGLCEFFRSGDGYISLRSVTADSSLGDYYQHISRHARESYALLQTPSFVRDFLLARTLSPALDEFGLSQVSILDPACGSGHFLLGAFEEIFGLWCKREPATDLRVLAERSLAQVTGIDINRMAVEIARFRLVVRALELCEIPTLERAPSFPIRVATGDSLLPWGESYQGIEQPTLAGESMFAYSTEDADLLADYLRPNQYTVVVGNPPYITVTDPVRSRRYRDLYSEVCYRQYAMTVPFAKRFFDLARRGDHDGSGAGWVGQITANSFMKREFGKKLINDYLAHQVELTEVIDTSGAHVPGHGTPTVMLVGRNRQVSRRYSTPIRAVLGIRGEPALPDKPAEGLVWSSIENQIDHPGSESEWISVTDLARDQLAHHPWSLSGGGASEIRAHLEASANGRLRDMAVDLGNMLNTREDDAYIIPAGQASNRGMGSHVVRAFVEGQRIRDWLYSARAEAIFPYTLDATERLLTRDEMRVLWPSRQLLKIRRSLSGTQERRGLPWYTYSNFSLHRYMAQHLLVFVLVATLPHFTLRRFDGTLFSQAATIVKLSEGASEDDHLRLLGVLNSSTACFWLKQVCHDKGIRGQGGGFTSDDWEHFYEFTGTKLEEFPLPAAYPLELARELDGLARRLGEVSPAAVAESGVPTRGRLKAAREEWQAIRARMISLQEELDWQVYRLYGLTDEELTAADPPPLALGERAFEIVLSRQIDASEAQTEWFTRHGSEPISEVPEHWPAAYRELVRRRIELIGSDRNIGLIERPECKRRWSTDGWDAMQARALRDWLLDRLEAPELWGGDPQPLSVAQLADRVRHDEDFRAVLDLWVGHDQHDPVKALATLVADEHVPFLSAYRYKASGLRKRARWERTWELQRLEDDGQQVKIDPPPKYASADFARPSYWRNRGKLDVPKERFISYPELGRDGDPTLLLGWAGWDHLGQARALATIYLDRRQQAGWPATKLLPLLAGLLELEPWLHQWHADSQAGYAGSPADFFTGLIDTELAALGADRATLATVRAVTAVT